MSAKTLFRNAQVFRFTTDQRPDEINITNLMTKVGTQPAGDPAPGQVSRLGFVSGAQDRYLEGLYAIGPCGDYDNATYLVIEKAERRLPGKAIRQAVEKKVKQIEKDESRKVYAKEKQQIKHDIVMDKLPHVLIQRSQVAVLISFPYIFVDTSSEKRALEATTLLREVLGSLPIRPLATKVSPAVTMTQWARTGEYPRGITGGEKFKSQASAENGQTLSGSYMAPTLSGVQQFLRDGHQIIEMEVGVAPTGKQPTYLTLTNALVLKGIQWDGMIFLQGESDAGEGADVNTVRLTTLTLLHAELRDVLAELLYALGGELLPKELSDSDSDEDDLL